MKIPLDLENPAWLAFGNHSGIIQSSLDFDYLLGREQPSLKAIIGVRQKFCRYFFGNKEILIPSFVSLAGIRTEILAQVQLVGIMYSGRRVYQSAIDAIEHIPNLAGGFIFAEGVTEQDALKLREASKLHDILLVGPASVGIIVGGAYKLGAIGGTTPKQIAQTCSIEQGNVAVISTSGGIVNEMINLIASSGSRIAYAIAVGGERFPVTTPAVLFKQALNDDSVKSIIYFGELGGKDEYEIADIFAASKSEKRAICYIAGSIAENFDTPQQFGHSKAMAHGPAETTSAKKEALKKAGLEVYNTFGEFEKAISSLGEDRKIMDTDLENLSDRRPALFVDRISKEDVDGSVKILGEDLLSFIENKSLSRVALEMFLSKKDISDELSDFFDISLRLLVDHGPQVSGVANTMIAARAGKDLVSSLTSGLLTIGPRFGGAINIAAQNWFDAVRSDEDPNSFVERFAAKKEYISGIGHRKYRSDNPDPRVALLLSRHYEDEFKYTKFAIRVAEITISKKSQLILNVDGVMAALLLDLLETKEKMSKEQIQELLDTEFCNVLFVMGRSIGLIAHYLEQKRIDEGLFRLPEGSVLG